MVAPIEIVDFLLGMLSITISLLTVAVALMIIAEERDKIAKWAKRNYRNALKTHHCPAKKCSATAATETTMRKHVKDEHNPRDL